MFEGSPAVTQFIDRLIDAKLNGTEIDTEVRETLRRNLVQRLEDKFIHAILVPLNELEHREVEHLIDSNQADKIEDYLEKHGVSVNQVLAGVMTEFQASYLGA